MSFGISPPTFRLPDDTRPGRVRLLIANLQRSIDYYERVIGLQTLDRAEHTATLGTRGSDAVLVELREKAGIAAAPRRGAFGLFHVAILLPDRSDLGAFLAHLASLGIRFGAADHWVSEAVYLTDPDGLGLEVYADRPATGWQVRSGELAMATEALDIEALVGAAQGRAWQGAPSGTRVGHLHLHVGDLQAADAFYHVALGLDKTVWSYPGALFLAAGGYHHHLGTNTWSPGPAATDQHARLIDWELSLPDADAAARAAQSLERAGFGARHAADGWLVNDPWGTTLRLTSR